MRQQVQSFNLSFAARFFFFLSFFFWKSARVYTGLCLTRYPSTCLFCKHTWCLRGSVDRDLQRVAGAGITDQGESETRTKPVRLTVLTESVCRRSVGETESGRRPASSSSDNTCLRKHGRAILVETPLKRVFFVCISQP